MAFPLSSKQGTLKGYDVVLSVSEEAVNFQLQTLYDKRIDNDGPLPPPTDLDNFAPGPETKFLINHEFKIHELRPNGQPKSQGIDGHIECPKLRFRPPPESKELVHRTAYVELKFKRDETAPKGFEDSRISFINTDDDIPRLDSMVINGYTFSWAVTLGQDQISDVQTALVDADLVPNRISRCMEKYVNPERFTVASIFCIFEDTTIINTFKIRDPSGQEVKNTAAKQALNDIQKYFTDLQDAQPIKGVPSPEYPFILGYGISEKIPDLGTFSSKASNDQTPACFIPRSYNLTVTKGDTTGNGSIIATSGTLNFCMLTYRDNENDMKNFQKNDLNAGLFDKTFFDLTKSQGRTKDLNGNTQGCDAVMAFSEEIFSDHWLMSVANVLMVDPSQPNSRFHQVLADIMKVDVFLVGIQTRPKEIKMLDNGGAELMLRWDMNEVEKFGVMGYSRRKRATGWCKIVIKYRSNTAEIQSFQDGNTHSRQVYLDIDIENGIEYAADTKGVHNLAQNEFSATEWLVGRTMDCTLRSLIVMEIKPSAAGMWSIAQNEAASKNVFKDGQELQWNTGERPYGNFDHFETHHTYKLLGDSDSNAAFSKSLRGWSTNTVSSLTGKLHGAFKDMGTTVIMPAGQVFTCSGLDTDPQGNLYARMNYANKGGVTIAK